MYDAIFIIGDEFQDFAQTWDALEKSVQATSDDENFVQVQSFRFSIPPRAVAPGIVSKLPLLHQGMMYDHTIDAEYTDALLLQMKELLSKGIDFRLTTSEFFKSGDIQWITDKNRNPYISITFEDKVENASRFFGQYIPALSKHFEVSPSLAKAELEKFYEHCLEHLALETPFIYSPRSPLSFFKQQKSLSFVPKHGRVGRHTIFKELQVYHENNSVEDLMRLFCEIVRVGAIHQPHLFFLYFKTPDQAVDHKIPAKYLRETTYDVDTSRFSDTKQMVLPLKSAELTDMFCVAEQKKINLLGDALVTGIYTLRKVPNRGYELRANLIWEEEPKQEPEDLIAPVEASSGLSWNRIV